MRKLALALVLALFAVPAHAQSTANFSVDEGALRQVVCPPSGSCRLELVRFAGRFGETDLALVRVRSGPAACCDEPQYRDYLVSARAGVVRRERLLVRGACPCLEWERSSWSYEHGHLTFTYGGMGAPPSADSDMRPTHLRVRVWPLAVTEAFIGDDPIAGPLPTFPIVISME